MSDILYDVTVNDGKYRFVYYEDAKPPEAYRHGHRWLAFEPSMLGSNAIRSLVQEIDELRQQKFPNSSAAVQIAEEAFRAGFAAASEQLEYGEGNPGTSWSEGDWYKHWSEWQPSEACKDLVQGEG